MLKNGDIIFFEDKDDFRSAVLKDALQIFSEKANVALLTKKNKENKITKTALPFTIDLEADKIIHKLIKEDIKTLDNVLPVTGKRREIVKPLYLFLDGEVLLYARLRKLKFKPEKSKEKKTKDKISLFIDSLEKKHPELKRAVVKSWLRIKGI
jgi:tRNA(Ile)-lysidine synthase TilS/MesJ